MPKNIIKSFAKKTKKSISEIEKLYKSAEKEAVKMGMEDNYAYIIGILKNMLGIEESISTYKRYESIKDKYEEILISSSISVRPEKSPKKVIQKVRKNYGKWEYLKKDKEEDSK